MSARNEISRADQLRKRRTQRQETEQRRPVPQNPAQPVNRTLTSGREVFRTSSISSPGIPRRDVRNSHTVAAPQKRNDFTFNVGKTGVRTPPISVPHPGARWVSGAMTLALVFVIYSMFTSSIFSVNAADITGIQRLSAEGINSILGVHGKSILAADPSIFKENVLSSFTDISSVTVSVSLPNHIKLTVVERTPVIAWYEDGAVTWVDANGIGFPQRGDFPGLVQISANGRPVDVIVDPAHAAYEQEFIRPEMVAAILQLAPDVPAGSPMIYDPEYGMGWQDPRGWFVYFGQNTVEIPEKLLVYSSIVDTFMRQGIQPTLVSMEFLDAPFYK